MHERVVAITSILAVCLVWALIAPAPALAQEPAEIVVEGSGEVQVAPDRATLLFSIETRAAAAQPAAEENARRQERALRALEGAGVGRDALSTISYGVQPEWDWTERKRRLIGYVAQTTIRVRTRELDQVGVIVDAALAADVNRVDEIRFEISEPEVVRRDALGAAVRNARAAAEAMAAAAGGSLGRLLVLTTRGDPSPPRPVASAERAMAMSMEDAETQVIPGEQTVYASVTGRWEFLPGEGGDR